MSGDDWKESSGDRYRGVVSNQAIETVSIPLAALLTAGAAQ
jgi:hypothetical protein